MGNYLLKCKSSAGNTAIHRPSVYICCHHNDFETYFKSVSDAIIKKYNYNIHYHTSRWAIDTSELENIYAIAVIATHKLLKDTSFFEKEVIYAWQKNLLLLLLPMETGVEEVIKEKYPQIYWFNRKNQDIFFKRCMNKYIYNADQSMYYNMSMAIFKENKNDNLKYLSKAVSLGENLIKQTENFTIMLTLAYAYRKMGMWYLKNDDFENSTIYYQKVISICKNILKNKYDFKAIDLLAQIYFDFGEMYKSAKSRDSAYQMYKQSLSVWKVLEEEEQLNIYSEKALADTYYELAFIHKNKINYEFIEKAYSIYRRLENSSMFSHRRDVSLFQPRRKQLEEFLIGKTNKSAAKIFKISDSMVNANISDEDTVLARDSFSIRNSLETLYIGANISWIQPDIFSNCENLKKISVNPQNSVYHSQGNCLIKTKEKKLILGCKNSVIPDDGSVEIIAEHAFDGCDMEFLCIPSSVKQIETRAFKNCRKLKEIIVQEGNLRYHSADNCLIETASKTAVLGCVTSILPCDGSVEKIGPYSFVELKNLKQISIPETVKYIAPFAFAYCKNLEEINIGANIQKIGNRAFCGCKSLSKLCGNCGENILRAQYIGDGAFEGCWLFEQVKFSESVEYIGYNAFSGCSGLMEIAVEPQNKIYKDFGNCLICKNDDTLVLGCKNSVIPNRSFIEEIGSNAFKDYGDINIRYAGTKAEWEKLEKDSFWSTGNRILSIECSDGFVDEFYSKPEKLIIVD